MTVPSVAVSTIIDPDWGNQVATEINAITANSWVTTARIADANVTTAKIADSNVTTAKIADSNVTTAKIQDSAVTSAKIADGTIVAGDLASNAVTTAKIADSNVTTAKIADSNVTTAKIADGNVTEAKLASAVLSTAWTALGDQGGNMSGENGVVKKLGNIVFLQFQGTGAGVGTAVLGALAAAYRPSSTRYIPGADSSGAANVLEIRTDGTCYCTPSLQVGRVYAWSGVYAV